MKELVEGTLVDGRYRVVRHVGVGGMADVYCAYDEQLDRYVALKVLHRRFAQDLNFVERFRLEASSIARLQHPAIVSVFDRGQTNGTYYIAMEYLDGLDLRKLLERDGPLPFDRAIGIAVEILRAVGFAHRHGIVHRDLKPQNVMVSADGQIKVTDFGIAQAGTTELTETGLMVGTAAYISPEQAQGGVVTGASDVYSVGAILYELIAGRPPFAGDSAVAVALQHVTQDPVRLDVVEPTVPVGLADIVMTMLSKQPDARYRDADAIADLLARSSAYTDGLQGPPTASLPAIAVGDESAAYGAYDSQQSGRGGGRRLSWAIAALVAALLFAGGVAALLLVGGREKPAVASVTGMPVEQARARLLSQGFEIRVVRAFSDAEQGRVLAQDPGAGVRIEAGATVVLTVSRGPRTAQVPDVYGKTLASAKVRIRRVGLDVEVEYAASDRVGEGKVVSTNPEKGESLKLGSEVLVVVSSGPKLVMLPDVVGSSKGEGVAQLEGVGVSAVVEVVDSARPKGEITGQSPAAGTSVAVGTSVNLRVSNGELSKSVPDVTGLDEGAATATLKSSGFDTVVVDRESMNMDEDGVVLSQTPAAGTRATRGSSVTLTVGRYGPADPGAPVG